MLLILFLGMSCLRFSFLPGSEKALNPQNIAEALLKDIRQSKSLSWKLVATYDPYQGGNMMRTDPQSSIQLQLYEDGTYKETSNSKIVNGRWNLNLQSETLKMRCERVNDSPVKKGHPINEYSLISYDSNFLCLGKTGRHGVVQLKFKILKATERAVIPAFF